MEKNNKISSYTETTYICNHCGNEGIMKVKGNYKIDVDVDGCFERTEYFLLECCTCHQPTILKKYMDEDCHDLDENGKWYTIDSIIYPYLSVDRFVPSDIAGEYLSMQRIKNNTNLYIFSLRRILDLILKEQGIVDIPPSITPLRKKIERLVEKNSLPEQLKDAAVLVKDYGNPATHNFVEKEIRNFTQDDIKILSEFIDLILNYIYVLPKKIDRLKAKISPAE